MTRRVLTLLRKEILHIRRDPRSLYLAVGLPIVLLILFGYAITFDIRHVAIGVVDLEHSPLSRDLISRFKSSDYFDLRFVTDDYAATGRILDRGLVKIILVVPQDFSRSWSAGGDASLQLLVDGSDNNTALVSLGYASQAIQDFASQALRESLSIKGGVDSAGYPAADPRVRIWFNPELKSTNFIVPGLIAVVMMVVTAQLTALTVAREWENGTMEQLIASPIRPLELVIGKVVPYFGLGMAQVALVVVIGTGIFHVPLRGDILSLVAVSSIFLLCGLGIGLFISIAAKSQQLAYMFAILLTLLPSFLLSGFIFPTESMPRLVRMVTYLVPARYFLTTLRGIFLKGYGFGDVWVEMLSLALFGLLVFAACVKKMRLRLD
jgi:ABC-2 type transport system permease protein